jgi:DNA replication protein DnaC
MSRPCDCRGERSEESLLRAAGIPRRYDHCTLDEYQVQDASHESALRLAREWIDRWPTNDHGLMFLGRPGTGKTHMAVAIVRELMSTKSARVLFRDQRELLKSLQGTFDAGSTQREAEVLGPVLRTELLVLDDLGAGRTTPWARDVMHDVIAQRYNDDRPLIMTSNLETGDEANRSRPVRKAQLDAPLTLRDRLGDALMSRLYEMCRIVPIGGNDFRAGVLNAKHHI